MRRTVRTLGPAMAALLSTVLICTAFLVRPAHAGQVFDIDFTTQLVGAGPRVVFETTVTNMTNDTWRLALGFDVSDAAEVTLDPVAQRGFLSPHEIATVQVFWTAPVPGHYSVLAHAWGKSQTASWSEWASASAGFQYGAAPDAPASTTNCTPYFAPITCISIVGSGLHVSSVSVDTRIAEFDYYSGRFIVSKNGVTWLKSGIYSGQGTGANVGHLWSPNVNLPNGTVLCGYFTDPSYINRKPCATVHS